MELLHTESKKRKLSPENNQMFNNKPITYSHNWKNFDRSSSLITTSVNKLFTKFYEIDINKDEYKLPISDKMFIEKSWEIKELQLLKNELNQMKGRLNDYNLMEWQYHTRKRNQAGDVQWRLRREIGPEFLTQAWCKFYENVATFPLVPDQSLTDEKFKSVHLCEAPGAFISSLNHWLKLTSPKTAWSWIGTTLNPHYEGNSLSTMIKDDRFILHTMDNWFFGRDNTGDLMKLNNLDGLIDRSDGNVMLVTADGSINCMDSPDEQELLVSHLHYCETIAALNLLNNGGSFLLKLFTTFEHQTVCLIYLLACCFDRVVFNKPVTSKEGNSEVYLVCLGFKGGEFIFSHLDKLRQHYEEQSEFVMFQKEDIPQSFVQQIIQAAEFFKSHQCEVISNNIRTFKMTEHDWEIKKIRRAVADNFIRVYKLEKLPGEFEIIGNGLAQSHCETLDSKFSHDSYNDRRKKGDLAPIERLNILAEELTGINGEKLEFIFQLTDKSEEVKISLGIPYEKIQSSRFCVTKFLKTFNSTFEIKNELNIGWNYPDEEISKKFIQELNDKDVKILAFQYTNWMNNSLIHDVKNIIDSLKKNQTLILIGYSLLIQLNVGLLYLLAHTFDKCEMKTNDDVGCIITLRNFKEDKLIIDNLNKIYEESEKAQDNAQTVLSVIPIAKLCDCKMYHSIMQMNHWIIKHFVNHILLRAKELS